jgi:hypothetical protein
MSIFGIAGAIGTGKSFIQLYLALEYANEREKQMVFNYPINIDALYNYCCLPRYVDNALYTLASKFLGLRPAKKEPRYPWILRLIDRGGISQIPAPKNLQALMIPDSVVCLDEAGILLNSRSFKDTPKELLADLAQSRKDGIDLFWCAQFDEQVDYQFRLLTQYWIYSQGLSFYDKKMKRPKLSYKCYFWFRAFDYFEWIANKKDRGNYMKTRFAYASKTLQGFLTYSDYQLFKVFNSFNRLDVSSENAKISTLQNCKLPISYYRNLLGEAYDYKKDPLSRHYNPRLFPTPTPSTTPPIPRSVGGTPSSSSLLSPSSSSSSGSNLIAKALQISRRKNIRPPFFKNMTPSQINQWINQNL